MAIKTFTTGEVLTAADTNTYLANSGLVFVKQQTIGTTVSSVVVTNAFSSTFENYKIMINGGTSSVAQAIRLVMGTTTTGNLYDYVFQQHNFAGTPSVSASSTSNQWDFLGEAGTNVLVNCDIYFPNMAQNTFYSCNYLGSVVGFSNGRLRNTTQYTDCTFKVDGNITGGTISVYGYRKG